MVWCWAHMAQLDRETIKKLARLSRIECSDDAAESLLQDLRKILDYVRMLESLDTEDVPVCSYVLEGQLNVMREDVVGHTLDREEFLSNSPAHIGGMIRVPPVLKQA